ncbi:MAG: Uncharacterized protein XD43_1805 [Thermococcales archaeon 44_46]|uniref:DUF1102 domain-containing protein n=1 Tax=Thermococcus sibiricus TaxID=172049 RepID=A0A117L165_9EURY|nr:DUF1102 domain-containing protein [Thermococcus sibiricus]KUJ98528.1 MAG: Uncharacterized protein XD43_1805 [Thermococcales archaeon 44_46]KUK16825.1 MAG: Uncharacterized protein XD54_1876 [Thermococcus sibiricus]
MRKILKFTVLPIILVMIFFAWGVFVVRPIPVVLAVEDNVSVSIENPLPPYAYLSQGYLKIDISNQSPLYPGFGEGLSPDTVYVFDDVFEIYNNESETGAAVICVVISSSTPVIGLFVSPYPGTWSQSIDFEVPANESVRVGMRFDTTGLGLGDYNQNITIQAFGGSCQ